MSNKYEHELYIFCLVRAMPSRRRWSVYYWREKKKLGLEWKSISTEKHKRGGKKRERECDGERKAKGGGVVRLIMCQINVKLQNQTQFWKTAHSFELGVW